MQEDDFPLGRAVASLAVAVVVLWALYLARGALLLLYISVILAIGFGPTVRAIEHQRLVPVGTKRLPRWLAILVVYLVIIGACTLAGLLLIPPVVEQASQLWRALPSLLDRGQTLLLGWGLLDHPITLEEAMRNSPASPTTAVGTVATAVTGIFSGFLSLLTVLIVTFYLLVEGDALAVGFARLFPRAERGRIREVSSKISVKVSAWLAGQLILAGTIGVSAAIGMYVLGVPYFYVLALVAAIGEMIPVVGPIFAAVPAVAVAFTVSTQTGVLVLVFFIAQQQVENNLLVPKIMEKQVGVSAVTVMVALLVGGALLGVLGAVLAVPTAAIVQVVLQELLDERDRAADRRHEA